jgi:hypothetical protein
MAYRLTVELDENEMSKVEEAARDLRLDPKQITAKQLLLALGAADGAGMAAGDTPAAQTAPGDDASTDARRARRLAAVMAMHGIWKDDPTKPQDGAAYQRDVRAEWR